MIEQILNGIPPEQFLGYLFWAALGVLISYLSEQYQHFKPIQRHGGFQPGYWLRQNWRRAVLSILAIFVGIVFMEKFTDGEPTNFNALTLGLTLDVLIERILKRKE